MTPLSQIREISVIRGQGCDGGGGDASGSELFEEAEVVFEEEADVGDVVFAHDHAFYAQAENKAGRLPIL